MDSEREWGGDDDGVAKERLGEDMSWMDVQPEMTKMSADHRTMVSVSF